LKGEKLKENEMNLIENFRTSSLTNADNFEQFIERIEGQEIESLILVDMIALLP
jgi:hypothetical protein